MTSSQDSKRTEHVEAILAAIGTHGTELIAEALAERYTVEWFDGMLMVHVAPAARHSVAAGGVYSQLNTSFGGGGSDGPEAGRWHLLIEQNIALPKDAWVGDKQWFTPDVAGWRSSRMPYVPDEVNISMYPDWVCEVLSTNWRYDRLTKMPLYARLGVPWVWLVDPAERTIEVWQLLDGAYEQMHRTLAGDARMELPPFAGLELDLSKLWLRQQDKG